MEDNTWIHSFRCAANCMLQDEQYESAAMFPLHLTDQFDRDHCGHYLCESCMRNMTSNDQGWRVKCPVCARPTKVRAPDKNIFKLLSQYRRVKLECGVDLPSFEVPQHQTQCIPCLQQLLKKAATKIQQMNDTFYKNNVLSGGFLVEEAEIIEEDE